MVGRSFRLAGQQGGVASSHPAGTFFNTLQGFSDYPPGLDNG
jgi:hypothetical protein